MIIILSSLLPLYFPSFPWIIDEGLDPGWRITIDYAMQKHLSFVNDITFSFGPYGSYWFPFYFYNPSTYYKDFIISLFFCISLFLFFYLYTNSLTLKEKLFIIAPFTIIHFYPLILPFYYLPLLFLISVFHSDKKPYKILSLIFSFYLAFSVFVKFTYFPFFIAAIIIADIYMGCNKKIPIYTILSLFWLIFLWTFSGEKILDIPTYFYNGIHIVKYHNEAMQKFPPYPITLSSLKHYHIYYTILKKMGSFFPIVFYGLLSFTVLLHFHFFLKLNERKLYFLLMMAIIIIFVTFKQGFVRDDYQHEVYAFLGLGFTFYFIWLFLYKKLNKKVQISSYCLVLLLFFTIAFIFSYSPWLVVRNSQKYYSIRKNFFGLDKRIKALFNIIGNKKKIDKFYFLQKKKIKNKFNLDKVIDKKSTVDIYPWDQTYLIANNLNYTPRPVFQSYFVFSKYLIEKNKNFLYNKGPQYLLFKIATIDNRLPPTMEGSMWLDIMSLYEPVNIYKKFLILHRSGQKRKYKLEKIKTLKVHFNEKLYIPEGNIYIKIKIQKNIWGKFTSLFYKIPPVYIRIKFWGSNKVIEKRLIPSISEKGFIISPYIDNIVDFFLFYCGEPIKKRVEYVEINGITAHCYKNIVNVELMKIKKENFKKIKKGNKLDKLIFYNRVLNENKSSDRVLQHIDFYKDNVILFSHVGTNLKIPYEFLKKISCADNFKFEFGIMERAYKYGKCKGAIFEIYKIIDKEKHLVFRKVLNPLENSDNRGIQRGEIKLDRNADIYLFKVLPRIKNDASWGWSFWKFL